MRRVLALGAAAWLTGEKQYAQPRGRILDVWFLAPRNHMNPDLDFSQSNAW